MIIVINCGSTSIKYKLFSDGEAVGEGSIENIGETGGFVEHEYKGDVSQVKRAVTDHRDGMELIVDHVQKIGGEGSEPAPRIEAVGHRVVHGGELAEAQRITPAVKEVIREYASIAPLHNPANLEGIEAMEAIFPDVPHVAVFDTAFHQTMPPEAFLYGLPYEYYEDYAIRKYGFHGISHAYVTNRGSDLLGIDIDEIKLITCHLGGGCSVTAVSGGRSIDTSMGFSPLEGIVMATRTGDIDPTVVKYLIKEHNMDLDTVHEVLNQESGLAGLSGISGDMRDLIEARSNGHERADLAIRTFAYRVKRRIGAYAAVLGSVDAIVFTAGIGEHSPLVRKLAADVELLGVRIDEDANQSVVGEEGYISAPDSAIDVVVIPTDEEARIAAQTRAIVEEEL